MNLKAKLVKFVTGDTVIAMMKSDTILNENIKEFVELQYPIEVITQFLNAPDGIKERYNLKPWQSLSEETVITVDSSSIILLTDVKEQYELGYKDMVDMFYFGSDESDMEDVEQQIQERVDELERNILAEMDDDTIH